VIGRRVRKKHARRVGSSVTPGRDRPHAPARWAHRAGRGVTQTARATDNASATEGGPREADAAG
jgi:hypothetical protein